MAKYVIIGNSAGGVGAAEAIRTVDPQGALTVISEETYVAYSRPLLPFLLAGQRTKEQMLIRRQSFYEDKGIDLRLGRRAVHLDLQGNQVELDNGQTVNFEKLLLATGAWPSLPDVKGADRSGVYNFFSIHDAQRMVQELPTVRQAVVLGGGMIALSVAKALTRRGIQATIVVRSARVLSGLLDEVGSSMAEDALVRGGVRVVTMSGGEAITGQDDDPTLVGGVSLGTGEQLPADLVVLARGVTPRLELAQGTGIQVKHGFIVDRHMATLAPSVYACGDASEMVDASHPEVRAHSIWLDAYLGGRVAGLNMAGRDVEFNGGPGMSCLDVMGVPIMAAGMVIPPSAEGYQVETYRQEGIYHKLVLRQGQVVGMVLVKDVAKSSWLHGLMRNGTDVTVYAGDLLRPDFTASDLPEEVQRQVLAPPERYAVAA